MSSLFGRYNIDEKSVNAKQLDLMMERMDNWNPDSKGVWKKEHIGFGHLMLHSTPDSLNEQLPFWNEMRKLAITADARIDNRKELFAKLRLSTAEQNNISDSQLILKTFEKWGETCVKYLIGDFAFAIWDEEKQQLFCARDHIGVRPFFYHYSKGLFTFASQMRGLLCLPEISKEWNMDFVHEMLFCGFPLDKVKTFYKNINRLEPAHTIMVSSSGISIQKYWSLEEINFEKLPSEESYIERARELIEQSIHCRLRTKFPVGAQLSGGLDSSGIAILAAKQAQKQKISFSTYSEILSDNLIGKEFPFQDERKFIYDVCEKGEINDYNFSTYLGRDISFFFEKQFDNLDGLACIDYASFTQPHAELASSKKVRTLFSGFVGDELVSLNPVGTFYQELINKRDWVNVWTQLKAETGKSWPIKNILRIVLKSKCPRLLYWYHRLKRTSYNTYSKEQNSLLNYSINKEVVKKLVRKYEYPGLVQYNSLKDEEKKKIENNSFLSFRMEAENIVGLQYKMNMVYPYADKRLLEFFYNAPMGLKKKNGIGRLLYREALKAILPESVLYREKRGYVIAPTYFHLLKKNHNKVLNSLILSQKNKMLSNLIDFKKLIYYWDSIKKDSFLFQDSSVAAVTLIRVFKKNIAHLEINKLKLPSIILLL